ncbi:MAG TPA: histidinol-phosphatase HisJ family protein [Chthonomonadaceae bacterium]|nr:histidinol-phosphatase HisJ family protein [Chthonomonadaceae bacterium]
MPLPNMIDGYYAIDYQVHSVRSHDGRATIVDQCRRAVEMGLDEIGFSEHKDFDPADPVVDYFDYDAYMTEIGAARAELGGAVHIRAGVEIDYQRWFEDQIAGYLDRHAFDFVIGSVHYVDRRMIMTPEYNAGRTAHSAYSDYFTAVRHSVESGLFDIAGHLEYANRRGIAAWGAYDPAPYREELCGLFEAMIARGTAFEINTAGLHQGIGTTYPCASTVALYAEQGGRLLTIGSDAHHPDQLGHAYAEAAALAVSHGLTEVCSFEGRGRVGQRLRRWDGGF